MKQFNLIVTCKFSDFAREYTGLNDSEKCMAFIEEQDQMWFINLPSSNEFLVKADLSAIWDSWVEVRIDNQMENGVYILNLTVITLGINKGLTIECDCVDLDGMLHNIIKRNI